MLMEHQLRVFDERGRPVRIIDASESKNLAKDEYLEGISCFVRRGRPIRLVLGTYRVAGER